MEGRLKRRSPFGHGPLTGKGTVPTRLARLQAAPITNDDKGPSVRKPLLAYEEFEAYSRGRLGGLARLPARPLGNRLEPHTYGIETGEPREEFRPKGILHKTTETLTSSSELNGKEGAGAEKGTTAMTEIQDRPVETGEVQSEAKGEYGKEGVAVQKGIKASFDALSQIEAGIVDLARNTVTDSLKATGEVAGEAVKVASHVMKGALSAAEEIGAGVVAASKNVAKGIVMGVSDVGGDVLEAACQTVKSAVKGAAEVGADIAMVARGTVDGVLDATKQIGGDVEETAKVAVGGAIEAAGAIGETVVNKVKCMMVGVVEGVKDVAESAHTKSKGAPENSDAEAPPAG